MPTCIIRTDVPGKQQNPARYQACILPEHALPMKAESSVAILMWQMQVAIPTTNPLNSAVPPVPVSRGMVIEQGSSVLARRYFEQE